MIFSKLILVAQGDAHGFMYDPPARSYINTPHYPGILLQCPGLGTHALVDYCPHCRNGMGAGQPMVGLSGAPGQGVSESTFLAMPRYDQAKGFTCPGSDSIHHEWVSERSCAPGGEIDLSFRFSTPHGGILRAFICPVGNGTPHHDAYDSNTLLTDPVFDDCWREITYTPPAGSPDEHLDHWYVNQGEGRALTGRYKLPDDAPAGLTLLVLQWTTSNSFYSKKFLELRDTDEYLWDQTSKTNNGNDIYGRCTATTSNGDLTDFAKECQTAALDTIPVMQDFGDWFNEQFRQLTSITIDNSAGKNDCHAAAGIVDARPFYWLDSSPTPSPIATPAPEEPTPAPVDPTPAPVEPTPAPVPTPEPTPEPTPDPTDPPTKPPVADPTPAPVEPPTPAPIAPTPSPTESPGSSPVHNIWEQCGGANWGPEPCNEGLICEGGKWYKQCKADPNRTCGVAWEACSKYDGNCCAPTQCSQWGSCKP